MKNILMVLVMGMVSNCMWAQGAYVCFGAGYGFNMSSHNLEYFSFYNYTGGVNSYTAEQVNVSLGSGLNFGASVGYMWNKNLGAELGISYLLGNKSKAKDSYSDGTTDYTLFSKMLRINPSLVIASGFEKINPYAKFGMIIGFGSITYEIDENFGGDQMVVEVELNGGMALGLSAGIGATYGLNEKMTLFGELNMVNMSYAPTMGEVTEATYNGFDQLPILTTSEKQIEFVDSYTYDSNNPPPDSEPVQDLKQKLPFGSFGLNVGLRIDL